MSASQEKKKRQELYASGQQQKKNQKKNMSKAAAWTIGIICAVVAALLVTFLVMFNTGYFEQHTTALTVGSHNVSPAMFNYFYKDLYQNTMSQFGDYANYIIDPDTPLDKQMYDAENNKSWADYFMEQTTNNIKQVYAVYDDASANGYQLDKSAVDSSMSNLDAYAAYYKKTTSAYLTSLYGKGSSLKSFREYVELTQTASEYSTAHGDSLTYTDDEVQSYYKENKDSFDTVSYRYFLCSVPGDEKDDQGNAVVDMAASEEMAKDMAALSKGDEQTFIDMAYANASESVKSNYENDDYTLSKNTTRASMGSTFSEEAMNWLFDTSRKFGDTTIAASENNGCYAIFFVDNSSKYDVNMVNVRHILIQPEDTSDDASVQAAKDKAQALLDQYLAGDKTEDAFAELAKANSSDSNAADGGLYENVYPDQMEASFNDWCFDPARKTGDTGIVQTQYGFHVMYFVGEGGNYQQSRIITGMRNADTTAWAKELGDAMTVVTHSFGMKFSSLK